MSNIFLGLNWKANPQNLQDANTLVDGCTYALEINKKVETVLFGPSIYLPMLMDKVGFTQANAAVGSQNISESGLGAFTGELSSEMLNSLGVKYALIGHSETRKIQKLNNKQTNQKLF
jgi:triosephosphate isomerase